MFTVAALYHFTRFSDPATLRVPLQEKCDALGITGSLLLAGEGVNGTLAGTREGIDAILAYLRTLPGCEMLEYKKSTVETLLYQLLQCKK